MIFENVIPSLVSISYRPQHSAQLVLVCPGSDIDQKISIVDADGSCLIPDIIMKVTKCSYSRNKSLGTGQFYKIITISLLICTRSLQLDGFFTMLQEICSHSPLPAKE